MRPKEGFAIKYLPINLALSVSVFILFLLMLEIASRIFLPTIYAPQVQRKHKYSDIMEYNSHYGWFHKKSFMTWIETQEYATQMRINSKGLRGKEYDYEKAPGTKRIIILGDSYTFGLGVNEDETFSAKLSELFQKSGAKTDVINMGVNGYGTDQEYLLLSEEGIKYSPDAAVCMFFVGNDIQNNNSSLQYGKQKPYFTIESGELVLRNYPVPEVKEASPVEKEPVSVTGVQSEPRGRINIPLKAFFQNHSYAYIFLRLRYNFLLYKLGIRKTEDSPVLGNGSTLTEAIFLKMREFCDAHSIKLLVVLIPTQGQIIGIEKNGVQRHFIEYARKNNINYLDLLGPMKGRRDLHFVIDSHANVKGNAFIAQILYNRLKK